MIITPTVQPYTFIGKTTYVFADSYGTIVREYMTTEGHPLFIVEYSDEDMNTKYATYVLEDLIIPPEHT
jgi:hypothetical protein